MADATGPRFVPVVHEDEFFVIVNKPANLCVDGEPAQTVAKSLAAQVPTTEPLRNVHQIDYGTSGLLAWAKTREAAGAAATLFQERLAKKQYLAVVHGRLDRVPADLRADAVPVRLALRPAEGVSSSASSADESGVAHDEPAVALDPWSVRPATPADSSVVVPATERGEWRGDAPALFSFDVALAIADAGDEELRMCCSSTLRRGKAADTRVEVLGYGTVGGLPTTKVRLRPGSGRRHQLRVHLASLGFPIVGDWAYGGSSAAPRMCLHAFRLSLPFDEGTKRLKTMRAAVLRRQVRERSEQARAKRARGEAGDGLTVEGKRIREDGEKEEEARADGARAIDSQGEGGGGGGGGGERGGELGACASSSPSSSPSSPSSSSSSPPSSSSSRSSARGSSVPPTPEDRRRWLQEFEGPLPFPLHPMFFETEDPFTERDA